MCGRFGIYAESDEYNNQLPFSIRNGLFSFQPNYNATPSQMLPVLYHPDHQDPLLETLKWGLIPHWSKDPKIGFKLFNARAETAHEKPSFRDAWRKRRALVPVNGWYEWMRHNGVKQPYYHSAHDRKLIWLAGLWEHWQNPANDQTVTSFTLVTQPAQGEAARIHGRMPVIVSADDYAQWLSADLTDGQAVAELLARQPLRALEIYPVSTAMNRPQLNDPSCIEPISLDD